MVVPTIPAPAPAWAWSRATIRAAASSAGVSRNSFASLDLRQQRLHFPLQFLVSLARLAHVSAPLRRVLLQRRVVQAFNVLPAFGLQPASPCPARAVASSSRTSNRASRSHRKSSVLPLFLPRSSRRRNEAPPPCPCGDRAGTDPSARRPAPPGTGRARPPPPRIPPVPAALPPRYA